MVNSMKQVKEYERFNTVNKHPLDLWSQKMFSMTTILS